MHKILAALSLTLTLALTACGGGGSSGPIALDPPPANVTIAQTTDPQGATHLLSLSQPVPALQSALGQSSHFVVVTTSNAVAAGSTTPLFVANGDVAIGDWRFALDLVDQDDAATILVFKASGRTVQALAGQLGAWSQPGAFNTDPQATQARLLKMVNTAIANAADPALAPWYADLANALTDPAWNGVLVFNPSLTALPAFVQGGPAPGQRLAAQHLRIVAPALAGGAAVDSVAGLIDYPVAPTLAVASPGDFVLPLLLGLRAVFVNSALAMYQAQVRFSSPGGSTGTP